MKKRTLKVIDKTIMSVCEKIIKNEKYCCEDEYYKTVSALADLIHARADIQQKMISENKLGTVVTAE